MWFEPTQVELVRDAFPEWMAFLFAFLSYLGSVWFVAPAVVLAFWFRDRHRFASWLGIVMGGYAVMLGLKGVFETPRPGVGPAIAPESLPTVVAVLYAPAVEVHTTSFPSGHAIAAVVVWTMLALEFDVGTRGQRWAGAAAMVGLVSFARVGAGVHFPIDVLVGAVVGVVYVAGMLAVRNRLLARDHHAATGAMFTLAAVLSLAAFATSGRPDAVALFGGCVGAALAWQYATPSREPWSASIRVFAHAALGLAVLGIVALVLLVVDAAVVWLLVGLVGGLIVVGLPGHVRHPDARRSRSEVTG
ncbi:phosphatase PAP2 family protein [Natronolimnohabitans innermongolicus]|uniref:PA-phosphatase-like phosphoesterase n=1 Tax=Natronolimnohabitans innermongolicus JCM 12255 TaxID=1227499 RepID=L9WSU4_9EURY|nr:phosphatase PAP2 family protein [Natronolimnohabitans innermongolicus]ELY52539.1 PA-phosphatase-like phosphoesterase [Natronolimnohabitans innermongolicus JCM 12255]